MAGHPTPRSLERAKTNPDSPERRATTINDMKTIDKLTKRQFEALDRIANQGIARLNYYSGSGRFSTKSADHNQHLVHTLQELGLVEGRHFVTGNDSPRGGWSGGFVKLMAAGKRLKVIQAMKG